MLFLLYATLLTRCSASFGLITIAVTNRKTCVLTGEAGTGLDAPHLTTSPALRAAGRPSTVTCRHQQV